MAYENTAVKREQRYSLSAITTEQAMAIIVIIALILLILIARGFRGLSVGGVSLSAS